MSRLTHGLADTESLQVLHSEKTLAYNTVLAYYFMQGSSQKSKELHILLGKIHLLYPYTLKLCFPFSLDKLGKDCENRMWSFTDGL